ncbi:PAS domain S-box protein [Rhodohalobacter sp.]|uniref:PAS domain-containing sensor histidine kinase n=1 Tax=Rhodohalobacter sp. TaxID=1974210 RepID=UPI00356719F2
MTVQTSTDSKNIIDCIQHGVIITDLKGRIIYTNSAADKIFGYGEDQIKGKFIRSLYGDEDVTPFLKVVKTCFHGESVKGNWHGIKSNGTKVWLDVRAKKVDNVDGFPGCVISIVEIDKLIQTKEKLKEVKALSQNVFESSTDAIITFDKDGSILSSNRALRDLFSYKKSELEEQSLNFLLLTQFNEDDEDKLLGLDLSVDKNLTGESKEMRGRNKNGELFPIEITVSRVAWRNKKIFTGIIRDLTARRNLERRIIESGQEERRKIGSDLHDGLGQMLTGTRMLTENLAKKLKIEGSKAAEDVEEIAMMIREADEFARTLARGMVQVDIEKKGLSVAIQELCEQTKKLTGVSCEFHDFEDAEVYDHNLALHLYRITQEAINNAIRHGKPDNVKVRLSNNERHTALYIVDDGTGFSEEKIPNEGSGIEIMKYRARVMGGIFEIIRTTDEKTQIRCVIPNNMQHFE